MFIPCIHLYTSPTLVLTSGGLALSFFMIPFDNEDFTFFYTNRVWVFDHIFVAITIQVYIPQYVGKILPVIFIWSGIILIQIMPWVYKDSFTVR